MLEIVECDLEKPGQIVPALGNASVVICCIGASEKEIFDVTGPYRIDFLATKNLVDAGKSAFKLMNLGFSFVFSHACDNILRNPFCCLYNRKTLRIKCMELLNLRYPILVSV